MSIAPLRSLRSFWAAGEAPGAFVRRDAQLRERLERIAASVPDGGALTNESSYATLIRSLDLNDVFASEVAERAASVDVARVRDRSRHHASPSFVEDVGRSRSDPRSPTSDRAARARSNAQGRELRDEIAMAGNLRPFAPPVVSSRASGQGSLHPVTDGGNDLEERDVDAVQPDRRRFASLLGAAAALRDVRPVAREVGEQGAAAVARILAEVDPALAPGAGASARSPAPSRPQPAQSPSDQLAKTVQRAERRLVEQRSAAASRVSAPDASYRQVLIDKDRGTQRDEWMPVDDGVSVEMPNGALPRPSGMRGLALRSFESLPTMRAPLFGLIPNASVDWPSSDIDELSNSLHDAARREGVELGELDA